MKKMIMLMVKKGKDISYKIDNSFSIKNCNDTNTYGQEWDLPDDYGSRGDRQIDSDTGWVIQDEDSSTGYYSYSI